MRLSEKFSLPDDAFGKVLLPDDLSDEGKWVFAVIVSVVCRCCCCLLLLLLLLSLLGMGLSDAFSRSPCRQRTR